MRSRAGGKLETKFNASGDYTDNGSDRDAGGNPAVGLLRRDIASTAPASAARGHRCGV